MYLTAAFNNTHLFQRLATWLRRMPLGRDSSISLLLHRASAAYLHLSRMELLGLRCRGEFDLLKEQLALHNDRIAFWSPSLAELLSELSPFMSVMVILQNNLLASIAEQVKHRGPLPGSLPKFLKRASHYSWLDARIVDILRSYWDAGGKKLRDYRDVDQHFHVLTNYSFLDLRAEPTLRVLLPDNPESKSPSQFTFLREVDAIVYCPAEFRRFHDTVERIAEVVGCEPSALDHQLPFFAPYQVVPKETAVTVALLVHNSGQFGGIELGQVAGQSQMFAKQLAKKESAS